MYMEIYKAIMLKNKEEQDMFYRQHKDKIKGFVLEGSGFNKQQVNILSLHELLLKLGLSNYHASYYYFYSIIELCLNDQTVLYQNYYSIIANHIDVTSNSIRRSVERTLKKTLPNAKNKNILGKQFWETYDKNNGKISPKYFFEVLVYRIKNNMVKIT